MNLIPGRKPVLAAVAKQWKTANARTRLAVVRRYLSVRQEDLAEATGISLATLQRLESGELGSKVQVKQLLACAAALEVPFTMLISDDWLKEAEGIGRARRRLHNLRKTKVEMPPDD